MQLQCFKDSTVYTLYFCLLGEVVGVDNRFADKDRQLIDRAISNLKPPVLPEDYSLIYCDILDTQGNKIGKNNWVATLEIFGHVLPTVKTALVFVKGEGIW